MFRSALCRYPLIILSMLSFPLIAQGPVPSGERTAKVTSENLAGDLGHKIDALQALLDTVRDAHGEPLRQKAMERHWSALQDYMQEAQKLTVRAPESAENEQGADCEVAAGKWKGLTFPGQLRADDYLKSMQAHLGRMREDLIVLHSARLPEALDSALRTHWRNNYVFLQKMRGLGWMFDAWMPARSGDQTLPAPETDGARLTREYCSICHAVPQARLHTAGEWRGVIATMGRHILASDMGMPMCVQIPSPEELESITVYFEKYSR